MTSSRRKSIVPSPAHLVNNLALTNEAPREQRVGDKRQFPISCFAEPSAAYTVRTQHCTLYNIAVFLIRGGFTLTPQLERPQEQRGIVSSTLGNRVGGVRCGLVKLSSLGRQLYGY
jgi:hypothetical protein